MSRDRLDLAIGGAAIVVGMLVIAERATGGAERASQHWPSFRGVHATGAASGQQLPDSWNGRTGEHVRWKVRVPGLAHSSPVVWGDRIVMTTAISSLGEATFKPGLYGAGTASDDRSMHQWKVLTYEPDGGKLVWERTAFEGVPVDKRHIKSTYASSTPATDGRRIVAWFGSQGLYAYDMGGKLLWKRDLGRIDVGAYDVPTYEWGPASSPIIWRDRVFLQVDTSGEDFVAALDLESGRTLWQARREELPSWGTPTIVEVDGRVELVTNGSNFIRGYDPTNGTELWRLGGSSQITAPTPILADGLIVVTSGRAPERPIFAIRPGSKGDLTLPAGQQASDRIAWSWTGRGAYMPTPLAHEGLLYVLGNAGLFDCYETTTGNEVYRQRLPHGGSGFSASPVLADGRLYLSSEDGEIFVVRAGRTFGLERTQTVGEPVMATPAISGGVMFVRGERHLFAIGR